MGSSYASCCVVVKNIERCIYAIPNEQVFQNNAIAELERNVGDSQLSETDFRTRLQVFRFMSYIYDYVMIQYLLANESRAAI